MRAHRGSPHDESPRQSRQTLGTVLETARLRGEPTGPQHEPFLISLLGDPEVGRTLGGVRGPAEVRASIARDRAHWRALGFGLWVFSERDSGEPVGRGGLILQRIDGETEVEAGWSVRSDRWRQGYATEMGAAAVEFAFDQLGMRTVISLTLVDNLASRRVMEKLGFAYEREVTHAELPHVQYRLDAPARRRT